MKIIWGSSKKIKKKEFLTSELYQLAMNKWELCENPSAVNAFVLDTKT